MKLTLKKVYRKSKTSAKGNQYISVGLMTEEFPEQWINGFGNKTNEGWKDGDVIDVNVVENEWQGKINLQFETPDPIVALDARIKKLEDAVFPEGAKVETSPEPEGEKPAGTVTPQPF